ncbi:MAG TPA: hypothetical protein VJL87_03815, partial [Bdellovibrionota bacterium]|nr:hypothetical protein [Bdellovibrionota bacterium]
HGDEGSKIIASDIQLLSEAHKREASKVHININRRIVSQDDLMKVKHILNRHRGTCRGFLHFYDQPSEKPSVMELDDSLRLAPTDELVKELEGLLGPKVVRFT